MNKKSTLRSVANDYLTHPRNKTGITLIALVITIIVLLILAGVSISIISSQDGILKKAVDAKGKAKENAKEELKQIDMMDSLIDDYVGNKNREQIIADLFSVAQTYKNNVSKLKFGSLKTAYDDTTENEIDCSSFLQLVLEGVPYEQSKYNSKSSNVQTFEYGIKLPDNSYADRRWLSNDIAHYAYDNNYSFLPNEDVTNVKAGDVIFWKTNGGNAEYFMGITHASIVIDRLDGDKLLVFHGNNTNVAGMQIINLFTEKTDSGSNNGYCNGATLIARFPFNSTNNKLNRNNLITNGTESVLNYNGQYTTCLKTLELSESLKNNTAYTLLVNMSLGTEEYADIYPAFVTNSYSESNKITSYTYSWVNDNKYLVHFITNDSITVNNIKIYMLSKSNIENKYRNGSFYSAKLYEGILTEEEIDAR